MGQEAALGICGGPRGEEDHSDVPDAHSGALGGYVGLVDPAGERTEGLPREEAGRLLVAEQHDRPQLRRAPQLQALGVG